MCSCTRCHVFVLWYVANLFQKGFGIIKQLLPLSEGDMTICSPSTGYICPRAILPASGEQIAMSPSLKGNNCILSHTQTYISRDYYKPEVCMCDVFRVLRLSSGVGSYPKLCILNGERLSCLHAMLSCH